MKYFNQHVLMMDLVIFLIGIITVLSVNPQPREQHVKTELSDKLPPEVFPKDDTNSSIPHHLQGELPPKIFPDDKAFAQFQTDVTTSKSDLSNKNNTKDTEHDDKSNETSSGSKVAKVASEIPDLLNTDYMNITSVEDETESSVNNDTESVEGSHVVNETKTHDEDASNVQRNCSLNESTEKNNSTQEIECAINSTKKNESVGENHTNDKYDSTTNTSIELTTEPGTKQNSTLNNTTEDETEMPTDFNNITIKQQYENRSEILEPTNVQNTSSAVEYNITIPTTTVAFTKDYNVTDNIQTTSTDNVASVDNSTTLGTNKTVGIVKEISTVSIITELPSAEVETTSVNISENIINQKAGAPVASATSQQHADHSHGSSGKSSAFLQPTESAAILAGIFVGIALLGYVGLLVWRRILEKRYGNREMLVNEDDFYDTNDLRNFEL